MQTLTNWVRDKDEVYLSTFMSLLIGSIRVSKESSSYSSIGKLCSCNQTIVFVSFVKAGLKNGCQGTSCNTIPFTVQGPPKRIFYLESSDSQRINRYPLGISEICVGPYTYHKPNKIFLMTSKGRDFPNNLPYIVN